MIYLFDTNAVSDVMRGEPRIQARLLLVSSPDEAAICPIIRGELLYGIDRLPVGKRRQALSTTAAVVLAKFQCLSTAEIVGDLYAKLKLATASIGVTAHDNDLWIASTAMSVDATIVTRDADMSRIPGLRVEDWTK